MGYSLQEGKILEKKLMQKFNNIDMNGSYMWNESGNIILQDTRCNVPTEKDGQLEDQGRNGHDEMVRKVGGGGGGDYRTSQTATSLGGVNIFASLNICNQQNVSRHI
jgi:hypothetical protein